MEIVLEAQERGEMKVGLCRYDMTYESQMIGYGDLCWRGMS